MDTAITSILDQAGVKLLTVQRGQAAVLPEGYSLKDLEAFLDQPNRVRETVKLTSAADFIAYVNRYKNDDSVIFITPDLGTVNATKPLAAAVIDYHGTAAPAWADHKAWYLPTPSPAYALLCAMDGKLAAQDEFAQHLRDIARFCTSHPGADLLEIISSMTLTSRGDFKSLSDDTSGSIRLGYDLEVSAQAGTTEKRLTVPKTLTFRLPVFVGSEPSDVVADLLYRTPKAAGQSVQLGLRLPERRWLELDLIQQTATQIREATGLMVLVGGR